MSEIQNNIKAINTTVQNMVESGKTDKRVIAIAVEMNQLYLEYLDELADLDLPLVNGVTVDLDGQAVRFRDIQSFSAWLAEHI